MKVKVIHLYVALVCGLAIVLLATHDWGTLAYLPRPSLVGLGALVVLGLLSESLALTVHLSKSSGNSSITFIPLVACVLLFGPTSGVVFMVITGAIGELLVRKKAPLKGVFNISQWICATTAGGWAFSAVGGVPIAAGVFVSGSTGFVGLMGPFIAFVFVFLGLNHGAVSMAVALSEELPFRQVWPLVIGQSGTNLLYDLLVSPIAIGVAFLFQELQVVGLLVALLPLLFVRHSYLTTLRLIQANRDLMKALVKAIETRDPYTSGHSVRVAALARRIAEELGLSPRRVDYVDTAALLHDIGKIEAVYSDILRKPDSLTDRERVIIESHVTKGVEVLTSLATFPQDVLAAVRGHHERVDGKGYPDGLRGKEIPLGARIIKVCDAIDAMLSDRPYRKALQLTQVREQLSTFAGIQFDQRIVEAIATSDLLESHAAELTQERAKTAEESVTMELAEGPFAARGRVMGIPQDSIAT